MALLAMKSGSLSSERYSRLVFLAISFVGGGGGGVRHSIDDTIAAYESERDAGKRVVDYCPKKAEVEKMLS